MNGDQLKGMIGLALRARQAAAGFDACRMMIRTGQCGIVLIDGATAGNTRRKMEELCARAGVPVRILPEGLIETATGRENRMMAVRAGSFAEKLSETQGTNRQEPGNNSR